MSGPPFCQEDPDLRPEWMREAARIIEANWTADASGKSTLPCGLRFNIESSGGDNFYGGKVPGCKDRCRIFLPGKPSERMFGIGYTYECDAEVRNGKPDAAGLQKKN